MKARPISLITPAGHIILLRWAVAPSCCVLQDVFWLRYATGLLPLKEVARVTALRRRKTVFLLQLAPPHSPSITDVTVSCSFHTIRAQRNTSEISQAANLPGEPSLLHSALCSQLEKRDGWRFKLPVAALIYYSWHHNALSSGISILPFYIIVLKWVDKARKNFLPNCTTDKTSVGLCFESITSTGFVA